MSESPNEVLFRGLMEAMNARRFDRLGQFLHEDYTEDYPQSGERITSLAAFRAILDQYPGREAERARPTTVPEAGDLRVSGGHDQWVLSPSFTVIRTVSNSDEVTAVRRIHYPDGSAWWAIGIYHVRAGKIASGVTYFAAPFEAPAWRAPYVERIGAAGDAEG